MATLTKSYSYHVNPGYEVVGTLKFTGAELSASLSIPCPFRRALCASLTPINGAPAHWFTLAAGDTGGGHLITSSTFTVNRSSGSVADEECVFRIRGI